MSGIKICFVSGSRAEFGQLLPLLKRIDGDNYFDLSFVVTGSHLSGGSGNTVSEIEESGIHISERIPVDGFADDTREGIAKQIGNIIKSFAVYFSRNRPEILVVIGDRYEMFGVAVAASSLLIPIAHICGGSTTSGALDEIYRHSITKMSVLHFTTCNVYRKRVIQLGEDPGRVFNVGSLAIENCLKEELFTESELRQKIGLKSNSRYCVVTFHPETLGNQGSEYETNELIQALDRFCNFEYVITLANADTGGSTINDIWKKEAERRKNFIVVPSLGTKKYLSALKYSTMMIGNSSSGTTEGPTMHIPTIDIGDRQKGRYFAESVIHCDAEREEIIRAILQAVSSEFQARLKNVKNPFGCGDTSEKIVGILKKISKNTILVKKDFYDVKFDMEE